MKWLLEVMGITAANSHYACAFCYCHKVFNFASLDLMIMPPIVLMI